MAPLPIFTPPAPAFPTATSTTSSAPANTSVILARVFQDQTNVLKPNDREMIVEFLNGRLRVNPRDAASPLHRIILNECRTKESNSPNRTTIEQIVFEMNFSSGHWRKLRRKAVVRDTSVLSARRGSKHGISGVSELSFEHRAMDRDGNPISEDEEDMYLINDCGR